MLHSLRVHGVASFGGLHHAARAGDRLLFIAAAEGGVGGEKDVVLGGVGVEEVLDGVGGVVGRVLAVADTLVALKKLKIGD